MPAYGKLYIKDSNGNLSQFYPEASLSNTEYEGATASANGKAGLVPPAFSYQRNHVLYGNGSWGNVNFADIVAMTSNQIDPNEANVFTKTITAATTFTIATIPNNKSALFNLILTDGGSKTVTWPSNVKWSEGVPPSLTASGIDVLTFLTPDGGITWYGTVALTGAA